MKLQTKQIKKYNVNEVLKMYYSLLTSRFIFSQLPSKFYFKLLRYNGYHRHQNGLFFIPKSLFSKRSE